LPFGDHFCDLLVRVWTTEAEKTAKNSEKTAKNASKMGEKRPSDESVAHDVT